MPVGADTLPFINGYHVYRENCASNTVAVASENSCHNSALIIDDWGMDAIDGTIRYDPLEMIDDRTANRTMIITSQLPVEIGMSVSVTPAPFLTAVSD